MVTREEAERGTTCSVNITRWFVLKDHLHYASPHTAIGALDIKQPSHETSTADCVVLKRGCESSSVEQLQRLSTAPLKREDNYNFLDSGIQKNSMYTNRRSLSS